MRSAEATTLAAYARACIAEALGGPPAPRPAGPAYDAPGATFVTLRLGDRLIGCIGGLTPVEAVADDVHHHALAAAFQDPRNVKLNLADLDRVTVELSILGPVEPFPVGDESDACARLVPEVDGVVLRYRDHQATFLPQVWESLPDPEEFLARLKKKAGLPASFWDPELTLSRYHLEKVIDPAPIQAEVHPW
ncbi:MAG: AmmeMemoRadiSam system protein A [Deltaproteobacteria bacterium]|jgi:AmmeMemoRadiSam system protein A|nr:AmmeMemoRadiSam system protein A [Deltaproteobacteria bacterium]